MSRYLIWDFDGTLGYRAGLWSDALAEVLRQGAPDCAASAGDLRPYLKTGYPWHKPDLAYPVRSADQWWEDLCPIFERAFSAVGVGPSDARRLARRVREVFVDPKHWRLFDDTIPTLDRLSVEGWTHLILSNHVPELGALAGHLGLEGHIRRVFNSAEIGYEKPHPLAFRAVLDYIAEQGGTEQVWMIGDNLTADVVGAEAAGIPALLVRKHRPEATRFCGDLFGVSALLSEVNPDE